VLDGAVAYSRGRFPKPDGMVIPGRGKDYAGHFVCVVVGFVVFRVLLMLLLLLGRSNAFISNISYTASI